MSVVPDDVRSFHQALDELRGELVGIGGLVADAIPRATRALLDSDLAVAEELVAADELINGRALGVEEDCLRLLTLQQPMAGDLRAVVTAVKLSWEIERSGDLVVNISKAAKRIGDAALDPRIRNVIEQMSEQAHILTGRAVEAYAQRDVALAAALDDMDDTLDALQAEYVQLIMDAHERNGLDLQVAVHLAMVGRFYERIGDHAVNIGERTQYMVSGWLPEHTGAARAQARARGSVARDTGRR
jgi:phosphate transport system protein